MGGCIAIIGIFVFLWVISAALIGLACAGLWYVIGVLAFGAAMLPWWAFLIIGASLGFIISCFKSNNSK